MKRVFSRITAAIFIASGFIGMITLGGCSSQSETAAVSGDIKVLAPMNDAKSSSNYSLQFIELSGLSNLQEVSGRFVRFFFSPRIIDNHLNGDAPKGKFIRDTDGNYIPADDLSQQMVVIYAHMQRLAQLDNELGAANVNKWPRDIAMGVRVLGGMSNNAFYDSNTDAMLFVPYMQENLPIAINAGILAHEHFHSLFYKIVMKNFTQQASIHDRGLFLKQSGITDESKDVPAGRFDMHEFSASRNETDDDSAYKYYHTTLLRGINEGLADFWGWMYTGNPDFIAASLPSEKQRRTLSVSDARLVNALPLVFAVKETVGYYIAVGAEDHLMGYAYTLGTQFSRMLKRFTDISAQARGLEDKQARQEVAKMIVKMLPLLRADLEKTNNNNYYSPAQFVQAFASVILDLHEKECEYLAEVLKNTSMSTEAKKSCKQDGAWKLVAE